MPSTRIPPITVCRTPLGRRRIPLRVSPVGSPAPSKGSERLRLRVDDNTAFGWSTGSVRRSALTLAELRPRPDALVTVALDPSAGASCEHRLEMLVAEGPPKKAPLRTARDRTNEPPRGLGQVLRDR